MHETKQETYNDLHKSANTYVCQLKSWQDLKDFIFAIFLPQISSPRLYDSTVNFNFISQKFIPK